MKERPLLRVGASEGDIIGADNRALQAAVDYVGNLGGGTVVVGEGVYLMHDSLHLRSQVTVRGQGRKTVLLKAPAAVSPLALDGDYGEEQVTVIDPKGFEVGHGVAVWDERAGGFHTTVATITGSNGHTFSISKPLNADCMVRRQAQAATVFPVISGYHLEGVRLEDLTVEGAREQDPRLNGCRGGGIFLYRCSGAIIERCHVRGYSGDGISFQQSNDVTVRSCVSQQNTHLGLHPGSGSQRPLVIDCVARGNGGDGLFLCWRVRHGRFENNVLSGNGGNGISIGHKDTDNVFLKNVVRDNALNGVLFREESEAMAAHRNSLLDNLIENNGRTNKVAGIRIDGETHDVVIKENTIRDTREGEARRQRAAVRIGERAGRVVVEGNQMETEMAVEDLRKQPR